MIDRSIFKKYPKPLTWTVAILLMFLVIMLIAWFISYQTSQGIINRMQQNAERECGNKNRERFSNLELSSAFKFAQDNIVRNNVNRRFTPNKLIDDDLESFAYPSSRRLDYTIDLVDLFGIMETTIVWNEYGERDNYVSKWILEGCDEDGVWITLGRGQAPQSKETTLDVGKQSLSEIRLRAEAKSDWIGVYEIIIK